ncbi:hypothetical protein Tco_0443376 [Tanacetum coccineum]
MMMKLIWKRILKKNDSSIHIRWEDNDYDVEERMLQARSQMKMLQMKRIKVNEACQRIQYRFLMEEIIVKTDVEDTHVTLSPVILVGNNIVPTSLMLLTLPPSGNPSFTAQDAVDVAVQLKYDRIREGLLRQTNISLRQLMTDKEIIQGTSQKEVSKIVSMAREVRAEKILMTRMEDNNSITGPADQEFETGVQDEQSKERFKHLPELFSDGTLDDVRTVLNDRLKGIRMEYLPETFWSQRDKANARAMIQAIDKRLKTRRINFLNASYVMVVEVLISQHGSQDPIKTPCSIIRRQTLKYHESYHVTCVTKTFRITEDSRHRASLARSVYRSVFVIMEVKEDCIEMERLYMI